MEPYKFPQSADGIRPELDLFSLPMTDVSVESCHHERLFPLSNINEPNGPIIFEYTGNTGHYLDLAGSYLYVSGKVVDQDGNNLGGTANISTSNLLLHSLFQNATLSLNETVVSDGASNYPYMSYTHTLLGNGQGTKTTELTSQLYYKDTDPKTAGDANEGYKSRKAIISLSKLVEMTGNLQLDICKTNRYIPNGVNLKLKLTKAPPEFYMWAPAEPVDETNEVTTGSGGEQTTTTTITPGKRYKFKFEEVVFCLKKISVNPTVMKQNEAAMKKGNKIKIPVENTQIVTHTIPAGYFNFTTEHLFGGSILIWNPYQSVWRGKQATEKL